MKWDEFIAADASVLTGKPVIRGTRLSVELILGLLADGWSQKEVLRNYPALKQEHICAGLAYARDLLGEERIFPAAR